VEFGEGDGKIPVGKIAEKAEDYRPSEKVTYKMIQEYVESKYGFKVHTAYIAEVKRDLGLPMFDVPNVKYHSAKKEMQKIVTAKANIDRLLGDDLESDRKEKSQEQR